MMDLGEVLLLCGIFLHAVVAPYTKVEESFNMQAIHDILTYGIRPEDLVSYDHMEFPGVVPRTFIGALIISAISYIPISASQGVLHRGLSGLEKQVLVRCTLGLCNGIALIMLKRAIGRLHGRATGNFFMALQATQFHIMYYASRSLPNMLVLPLTTVATIGLIRPDGNLYSAIFLLTCATVIFRAEILLLTASFAIWHVLITRRITLIKTVQAGIVAGGLSIMLSFATDSYFWGYPVVPEITGFYFNVVEGKSADWGTSPWYQYGMDLLKLLLNPSAMTLLIPAALYTNRNVMHMLFPAIAFVVIYSLQPHKEWRFIVYIVPQLTYCSAVGAAYIYNHRSKNILYKLLTIGVLASIPISGMISGGMLLVSSMNYPGGEVMHRIPRTGSTYLDVLTCMTGSTKFLQSGADFKRPEEPEILGSVAFWNELSYASVSEQQIVNDVYEQAGLESPWETIDVVYGYDGLDIKKGSIRKAPKLVVMRNNGHVIAPQDQTQSSENAMNVS